MCPKSGAFGYDAANEEPLYLAYSWRRASMGSMAAARMAG